MRNFSENSVRGVTMQVVGRLPGLLHLLFGELQLVELGQLVPFAPPG